VSDEIYLIAIDEGPRQSLAPLEQVDGFKALNINKMAKVVDEQAWSRVLAGASGVVLGTSESERGREIEMACLQAALKVGLPAIVVEDYPGSYRHNSSLIPDLLVVDSEFSRELSLLRLSGDSLVIQICPAARYDPLRQHAGEQRRVYRQRLEQRAQRSPQVLWVGQPETQDALNTSPISTESDTLITVPYLSSTPYTA